MKLFGRRIHIVGSVSPKCDAAILTYMHSLVANLSYNLAKAGATFVLSFGKEPLLDQRTDGPSIIFDWTIAESVFRALNEDLTLAESPSGKLVVTVSTDKLPTNIPSDKQHIYDRFVELNAIRSVFVKSGWNSGAYRRQIQANEGDILIAISGGEGVEHLAQEYSDLGKPVIPFDIDLESSGGDGSGGAAKLFKKARVETSLFFRVESQYSGADLLNGISILECKKPVDSIIKSVQALLEALQSPPAFYVRLLNPAFAEYDQVERFFRECADPVVTDLGFTPLQMGVGTNEFAWMNQAIFESLHFSGLVIIDLTAQRPNCFIELGYALGLGKRVLITALEGTPLPFDISGLEVFFWKENDTPAHWQEKFRTHWSRNFNAPKLVKNWKISW